ncbi:uncharacterized protein LACBIDRAFT_306393 [Laccaria bicolor S238N-H82]|uniref:Predicted protein n=1 Tax=Laccaria bicolor (strain S238N-H82 / ATCC MYA-4686) TaxID=486041 RepID=B0DMT1_LACBS|nr:uncharacterized protein LACBIDRAFT_306393 [Laccaria bicolor S238N-H82]EDR04025.1 predicted protein [Laccaria bicolor S238N-H82]|eukprot:XP_001885280.1 predicted protein [Laccaria bicolor S238N-H82]
MKHLLALATLALSANAYWLMGVEDFITTERIDPIVNPGKISSHVHSGHYLRFKVGPFLPILILSVVLGGSNFRFNTNTTFLRQSKCTSIPIPQDKSNYWFPHLYFQWANNSFTSLDGGAVICTYYLFSDTPGKTTPFPDDFRMLSGTPTLRTYDPTSFAQQAVTFLCLNFNGQSTKWNHLPTTSCPSGIRAQINFPSCWDGKNVDSADHKSHVAFLSGGPDSGTCSDPKFPVTLPRIFIEVYWGSQNFDAIRSQAKNSTQPFVYSSGDPTGYGYHADFINGWDAGVLKKAVDGCHCNPYGDPTCCANAGIFTLNQGQSCRITKAIDEQTTGTLLKLPGNNPVQPEGKTAAVYPDTNPPELISPVYAYTGNAPTATGQVVDGSAATDANNVAKPPVPTLSTSSVPVYSSASSARATSKATPVGQPVVSPVASAASSPYSSSSPGSNPPHKVDIASPPSDASGGSTSSENSTPEYDECEDKPSRKRPNFKGNKHRRATFPQGRSHLNSRFMNN